MNWLQIKTGNSISKKASICTKDTKKIYLQYCFQMNYIATNSFLHWIKLADYSVCNMFYDCDIISFWNSIVGFFSATQTNYKISIYKNVLLVKPNWSYLENFYLDYQNGETQSLKMRFSVVVHFCSTENWKSTMKTYINVKYQVNG